MHNTGVRYYIVIFLLALPWFSMAQPSSQPIREDQFIEWLIRFHPQAQSAALLPELGRQEVLAAKGLFDPIIGGTYYRKDFQDRLYYSKFDAGIVQPIRFLGADLQAGIEMNSGSFLNPERSTPIDGLGYLGLRLPLLQGLSIDRRRTELKLSEIYKDRTNIQSLDVYNDILINGLNAYWSWVKANERVKVLEEVLSNNEEVFQGIRIGFLQGDRPAIDTVEAYLQYQNILMQYNRELVRLQSTTNNLQSQLFSEQLLPRKISKEADYTDFVGAKAYSGTILQLLELDNILDLHPSILILRNESERLAAELKWEAERLKPQLDLHYNLLSNTGMSPLEQSYFVDNYQMAINFQFPLLFRTARGRTERVKILERQNQLAMTDELNFLVNASEAARYALGNLREQLVVARGINENSKKLYEAELTRFGMGESSVFLVNTRELQYLHAQNNLIDLETEAILQAYRLLYDLGALYRIIEIN